MLKELLVFIYEDKWFFITYSVLSYLVIRGFIATVKDIFC